MESHGHFLVEVEVPEFELVCRGNFVNPIATKNAA